jgi:hypothetical protein
VRWRGVSAKGSAAYIEAGAQSVRAVPTQVTQ